MPWPTRRRSPARRRRRARAPRPSGPVASTATTTERRSRGQKHHRSRDRDRDRQGRERARFGIVDCAPAWPTRASDGSDGDPPRRSAGEVGRNECERVSCDSSVKRSSHRRALARSWQAGFRAHRERHSPPAKGRSEEAGRGERRPHLHLQAWCRAVESLCVDRSKCERAHLYTASPSLPKSVARDWHREARAALPRARGERGDVAASHADPHSPRVPHVLALVSHPCLPSPKTPLRLALIASACRCRTRRLWRRWRRQRQRGERRRSFPRHPSTARHGSASDAMRSIREQRDRDAGPQSHRVVDAARPDADYTAVARCWFTTARRSSRRTTRSCCRSRPALPQVSASRRARAATAA